MQKFNIEMLLRKKSVGKARRPTRNQETAQKFHRKSCYNPKGWKDVEMGFTSWALCWGVEVSEGSCPVFAGTMDRQGLLKKVTAWKRQLLLQMLLRQKLARSIEEFFTFLTLPFSNKAPTHPTKNDRKCSFQSQFPEM